MVKVIVKQAHKSSKKPLKRKEKRKQERVEKKDRKRNHVSKPLLKSELPAKAKITKAVKKPIELIKPTHQMDAYMDDEDKEIMRLGKLLGIDESKHRNKSASKLSKEYAQFEGIGGDFGSFLLDLDKIGKRDVSEIQYDSDNDIEEHNDGHIIDDDEQEQSDIEGYSDEDEEDGIGDSNEGADADNIDHDNDHDMDNDEASNDEENMSNDGDDDVSDEDQDGGSGDEDNGDDDNEDDDNEDDENEDEDEEGEDILNLKNTYVPSAGEDIYGRIIDPVAAASQPGKYVPPALRKAQLGVMDENSDHIRLLRRQVNGLMNRLSGASKDSIVHSLKALYDNNSTNVMNFIMKDCIVAGCSNPTQIMTTLIPLYAGIVAALHFTVGADVGAYVVEQLVLSLHKAVQDSVGKSVSAKDPVSTKLACNTLLILVYLYNLRVLHHELIVDLMNFIVLAPSKQGEKSSAAISHSLTIRPGFGELDIELIVCMIDHCGSQLRADDPLSLRNVITALSNSKESAATTAPVVGNASSGRYSFMLNSLTDLKNNKSRRVQNENAEDVKALRKWLGTVKSTLHSTHGDICLRVSLTDLLDASNRGRWWKAGASWVGKKDQEQGAASSSSSSRVVNKSSAAASEEQKLVEIANQLKFNTSSRRNVFVVLMSSRDVQDAFERLCRLDLKGKQDRDVMRVVIECCSQEASFNAYYAEVAAALCEHNRQFKITTQFIYWDIFKVFLEGEDDDDYDESVAFKRAVNLARMLAHLVVRFHVPLSVIKTLDIGTLNSPLMLFLSTFFMCLFSSKVVEDTFQSVFDRVATTKDYSEVRENVLMFLQRHLTTFPKGMDEGEAKIMKHRRKIAIKTMESMEVLDFAKGKMAPDNDNDDHDADMMMENRQFHGRK